MPTRLKRKERATQRRVERSAWKKRRTGQPLERKERQVIEANFLGPRTKRKLNPNIRITHSQLERAKTALAEKIALLNEEYPNEEERHYAVNEEIGRAENALLRLSSNRKARRPRVPKLFSLETWDEAKKALIELGEWRGKPASRLDDYKEVWWRKPLKRRWL